MKLSAKAVIAVAVYLSAVVAFSPVVRRSAAPPLEKEFERMKVQLYSYYDRHGEVPRDLDFFPPELKRLVADPASGISWDPVKQELVYQYPKAYPLNRSFVHSLTFGLISPGAKVLGSQVGPDGIRTNTPLYKEAGLLNGGAP